jgi:DNA primase
MIPNDFIQTLLGRVDIVEIIDRYVPLRKAGANYVACCPFHKEKTPSFTVSPSKQFYHCFGCGAHGTAIGFVMEYGGKPFVEAVEDLARHAGLTVPRTERAGDGPSAAAARWLETLQVVARFYRQQLKASERAIAYLRGRGLTGEIAREFGIGYAPPGWQGLAQAVPDYADAALEQTGLVIVGDGGRRYDRFRDRIMFPILDSRGQVIGFGGRILDAGEPKYMNSPETPLFSKGRELYGLAQARQAIRDSGQVVVVEGYMDVVALAQFGVRNAVATLGTATTPAHAAKLLRHADLVCYCFDGDEAGRRAAWRALESTVGSMTDGKEVRFVFLPEGQDPDDFVRTAGSEAFSRLAEQGVPLSDFLLRELADRHPPSSAEGKAALVAACRPYLEQLQAPVLAAILRRRVAEVAGLAPQEVSPGEPSRARAATALDRPSGGSPAGAGRPSRPPRATPSEARSLLKAVLSFPPLVAGLDPGVARGDSAEAQALAAVFGELADPEQARAATTASLLERLRESPHTGLLWRLARQIEIERLDEDAVREEVRAIVARQADREEAARVGDLVRQRALADLTPEERARLARFRRPAGAAPEPGSGNGEPGGAADREGGEI